MLVSTWLPIPSSYQSICYSLPLPWGSWWRALRSSCLITRVTFGSCRLSCWSKIWLLSCHSSLSLQGVGIRFTSLSLPGPSNCVGPFVGLSVGPSRLSSSACLPKALWFLPPGTCFPTLTSCWSSWLRSCHFWCSTPCSCQLCCSSWSFVCWSRSFPEWFTVGAVHTVVVWVSCSTSCQSSFFLGSLLGVL